jgi:hypothetical protein
MRALLFAATLLSLAACSRAVKLEATPNQVAQVSVKVTNTTSQAISVYVQSGGSELFLKQVSANATEIIPVPGIAAGTTVRLRATLADGSHSYTRDGVVLTGVFEWQVP